MKRKRHTQVDNIVFLQARKQKSKRFLCEKIQEIFFDMEICFFLSGREHLTHKNIQSQGVYDT